jgi:hypothetical protein
MTIAIIGAGNVGRALARGFVDHGMAVRFGVPDPAKHPTLSDDFGGKAIVSNVATAVDGCAIAILAVPYAAAAGVAQSLPDWAGRILVDATNPIAAGLSGLALGTSTSGAEEIARHARNARVVKAFNTTGAENLGDPRYADGKLFMPVAGDDAAARAEVVALANRIGFDAVDVGGLAAARYLEPWAMLWIHMAIKLGHGRGFGFARVRRDT